MKVRRKLIEVALPLEAINAASSREKSIRHGHPSTLHIWWARRPLAAARAVIFSQMVDDPSEYVDVLREDPKLRRRAETVLRAKLKLWQDAKDLAAKAEGTDLKIPEPGPEPTLDDILADQERQRLFRIIEDLVVWENTTNEAVLQAARDEIWASWRRTCLDNIDDLRATELFDRHVLPAFHDPFAGGGALPLEAQRLGLVAYASDLNPVAVLINKAMIEIPPRFAGRPPVNPASRVDQTLLAKEWRGARGLAEDVRYYGQWMRDEAEKRIGHLYPDVEITPEIVRERPDLKPYLGRSLTVIAWLWARTVKSPNPAFATVDVPLTSTFFLSTKPGKEVYVEPLIEGAGYRFAVKVGKPRDVQATKNGTKLSQGSFRCLMSNTPFRYEYVDEEANAGRMGARLMAVVADGDRGRVYLSPSQQDVAVAESAAPGWKPDLASRGTWASNAQGRRYGFRTFGDYFTKRQLVALLTFSELVQETRDRVLRDAQGVQLSLGRPLPDEGETGAQAYADAVAVYLAFAVSKITNIGSSMASWMNDRGSFRETFARQGIAMTWDFAEANAFAETGGSFSTAVDKGTMAIDTFPASQPGAALQLDAATQGLSADRVVSCDPPYYDNIGYADLSDFFYVWLRHSLRQVFPQLFATLAVPKAEELVAESYRHGSKAKAEAFFLDGMTQAMHRLAEQAHPAFPVTIYYAFKQAESDGGDGTTNTGWDTFLAAVIKAGFAITGTWPMRTEGSGRMVAMGTNALASSIVLVCRRRPIESSTATRREFVAALRSELPIALANLQRGNVAPVDLAQAAIGPGMAMYTRYEKVIDAQGKPMSVREALSLINATLDEALAEQEGDFDADSRWALAWYDQYGFGTGPFGAAETLSTAKNISVEGMVEAGILTSRGGDVRLLRPTELDAAWDPTTDRRRPAWQAVHQLILASNRGEAALADLIAKLGPEADAARELAYRLYVLSERKKRTEEAGWYNGLVQSWTEAVRLAAQKPADQAVQGQLFGEA